MAGTASLFRLTYWFGQLQRKIIQKMEVRAMKIKICLLLVLSLLVLLGGCAGDPVSTDEETGTAVSAAETSETAAVGVSSSIAWSENEVKAYSAAYYDIIEGLINQYGFYTVSDETSWSSEMGFVRGDLIDFEGDGIPELICIYRKEYYHNVRIYQYKDDEATLLTDERAGISPYGQNWSAIEFSGHDEKPYILVLNCDPGKTQRIEILTVGNGTLKTTTLSADVQERKSSDPYLNCRIDGKDVTEEEYIAMEEAYYDQETIPWNFVREGDDDYRCYKKTDAILLIQSLAANAGVGETEVDALLDEETEAADSTAPVSSGSESGAEGPAAPVVSEDVVKAYSAAYYDVVEGIIDQYGFYTNSSMYCCQGFVRGYLIDFEGDGIPELVCIYGKWYFENVRIYRYTGGQAVLLVDELTGNAILGDNWSDIYYNIIDEKPYILTQNCDWGKTEKIKIFTVDKGALVTTEFYADALIFHECIIHYFNCRINDKNVSEDAYIAQKEYLYKDAQSWGYEKENGDWHDYDKDDAIWFIKSLAADAGVGDAKVDALLGGEN